ncbi:dTDP-glucose 4,6-dehydratase [Orrella sp. 11846]|uniref:dTDP-glucose 4,6-dehydratase n=1 Tax=Orrella sp. 11846 TaxID=3409913 RepID=UPI003B5CBDB7
MIIVTGGAGFIGSNFIHLWLENQQESVLNLDLLTYAGNPENLSIYQEDDRYKLIQTDIGNRVLIDQILAEHKPRAILNFAAESHVDRSILGPQAFLETNVMGTFHLLESTRNYWTKLPLSQQKDFRFIHVSTDEVFGTLTPEAPAFTENHPYEPNSPYSASKASSDHLVRAWHHTYGLPTITTHCSNNYGPYHFPEKLIPLVILNALQGKSLPIYGDGQQVRDWLYVRDHAQALMTVLADGEPGQTYNIGGNCERTNLDVVRTICTHLDQIRPKADGLSYAEQITFVTDRPGHDRRYAVDTRKISQSLGWEPEETFETGLLKTIQWYLDNPEWVEHVTSGAYRQWIQTQYQQP